MEDWQQRVVDERRDLAIKLNKLDIFIQANPAFNDLIIEERQLLRVQRDAMRRYEKVLNSRIARFPT